MTDTPAPNDDRLFRQIVETANEGVWVIDADARIVYANEYLKRMLGYPAEAMIGRVFVEFFHADEREAGLAGWRQQRPGMRRRLERRFVRSDGAVVWANVSITATPAAAGGQAGGSLAMITDITEQKRAEAALRDSEARYRQIVETANEGILSFGRENEIVYVNDGMARMLGYAAAEMIGRPLLEFIAEGDLPQIPARIERSMEGRSQRYERQLRHKDGGTLWGFVSSTPTYDDAGRLASVLCMITDVSEQKRVEVALQQQERQFREIVETANEGIWVADAEARLRYVNDCIARMLGRSEAEMLGRDVFDFVVEEEREAARAAWRRFDSGKPGRIERRLLHADGSTVWAIASVTPRFDATGRFVGVLSMITDISEQKRAEAALQRSRESLEAALAVHRRILECSLDVICTFNDRGEFVEVSDNCESMWGYRREELIGKSVIGMIHPDDRARTLALGERLHAGHRTRDFENRHIRKDGSVVPILWSAVWEREDGRAFAVAHDLSEWRSTEEKLKHFEKMQAIGQLTGGVAHDFNNLLTVILGNASIFLEELEEGHRLRPLAETTRRAAERGADLTARLLAFARRQPLEPQAVDVNALIERMMGMLHRTLGESIRIDLGLAPELWPAWIDSPQLETALLNLAINARDAMPSGGRLSVETLNLRIEPGPGAADLAPGDYVAVSIIDTGSGMRPEVAKRAVEPFFTTKDVGKGSGLGLSMVYGFVKQSGGHARIDTEPGRGTAVHLFLPRAAVASAHAPSEAAVGVAPTGHETVLVVEDDELVRDNVESQLRALGYSVVSTADAHGALAALASGAPVDLLFTDVIVPGGMNGRQLAEAARQRRPGLKVLFTSGYSQDVLMRDGKLDSGVQLLSKPYRRQDMAHKIRAVLHGAAPD